MKVTKSDKTFAFIFGGLIGAIVFYKIYGFNVIAFTNTDWLLSGGELTRGYIGWVKFRQSSWHIPLGLAEGLADGSLVSIIYTGSIPLPAIIFKLFSSLLPSTFQYFGLWGFLCFIIQGGLSAVIFRKYTKNVIFCALGAVLMTACPVLIEKMFTDMSLASHFMVLIPLYLWVYREEYTELQTKITVGLILGALSVFISYYFFPIMGIVLLGYAVEEAITDKKIGGSIVLMVAYCISFGMAFILLGGLHNSFSDELINSGLYNANLNALWNTTGFGTAASNILQEETNTFFLKGFQFTNSGQTEGFAYLGLGIIVILIASASIYLLGFKKDKLKDKVSAGKIFGIGIMIIVALIFCLGTSVTFGTETLINIPYPAKAVRLLTLLKYNGRFIIIIVYMLTLFGIANLLKQNKPNVIIPVVLVAILLQSLDMKAVCGIYGDYKYSTILETEILDTYQGYNSMVVLADPMYSYSEMAMEFAIYAEEHNMNINMFPFERPLYYETLNSVQMCMYELENGTARPGTIYIFADGIADPAAYTCLTYGQVNGITIGIAAN